MLLGRDSELEAVSAVCREAAAGRGSALVVAGEPGIGKTALLGAAASAKRDVDAHLLRATGVEAESTVAFASLQALLWPLRERLDELEESQTGLLRGVLDLGSQAGASTFAIGAAALALLSISSRERPLVAIVDDAQWADVASQEVLCFVGRRLEQERIALLVGVRENERSLFLEERSFARLELVGLAAEPARSLLTDASPTQLAPAVADRLLEACAGNPLGLIELPRGLTDAQRRGTEALPASLEAGPLVQRAFATRAAALSPEARNALLVVAAAGDAQAALAAMDDAESAALAEAEAAGLILRTGQPEFRHPLMQSAVYGAAAASARREAHRRVAAVVLGARRAWHLAAAADGPDEDVAQELETVAEKARLSGGVAAQAQALERAAGLTFDAELRARRLLAAAQAWRHAGRIEHAQTLLEQALELAGETSARAPIQLERGLNLLRALSHREAYELLSSEARRAEADDAAMAARLYAARTFVANVTPETPPALESAEQAVALAGRGGDAVELEALFALVSARMGRGLPPDEEDDRVVARAAELLERPELRTGEQPHWIAYSLAELERDDDGRALSDLALAEARATGDVWSLCYGL